MESKKSEQKDLERKTPSRMWIGLMFACAVVLVAFEWRTFEIDYNAAGNWSPPDLIEEEIIPISRIKPPPPPPPPKSVIEFKIVEEITEPLPELELPDLELEEEPPVEEISNPVEVIDEERIYMSAEVMPGFPGGDEAFYEYLRDNLKYAKEALHAGVSGKVHLQFVVAKDGSITDVQVLDGPGYGLNEEALRVISNMPNWSPGKQNGIPVKVEYKLPISFSSPR